MKVIKYKQMIPPKFGAKQTTPVAWAESAQILALRSSVMSHHAPTRASFPPKTQQGYFDGYAEIQNRGKLIFHLSGTPFADFFQGKWAKMGYLTKYWSVPLQNFCNDVLSSNVHYSSKNDTNRVSR